MRNTEKQDRKRGLKVIETKIKRDDDLGDDVDALFRLPLAEFTGARNALAATLKKRGRGDAKAEAVRVKALVKPPVSAWAVNQLYWNHREAFDQLIASGERFHKAQASRGGGKIADMREALDARRTALTHLTDLATSLLRDAGPNPGQNPAPDTIHRITTTLEAMSAMSAASDRASRSDRPRPGRLTHDVDPPGFESFASFVPAAGLTKSRAERQEAEARSQTAGTPGRETLKPVRFTQESSSGLTNPRRKVAPDHDARQLAETRKAKMAAAKVSLQDAKRSLTQARARAQSLEAARKKADAEVQKAEKHQRDAEEELRKAKGASEDAGRRARGVAVEVEEAATAVNAAERAVEKASKELESMVRESSEK